MKIYQALDQYCGSSIISGLICYANTYDLAFEEGMKHMFREYDDRIGTEYHEGEELAMTVTLVYGRANLIIKELEVLEDGKAR